jgi:repressor LexA
MNIQALPEKQRAILKVIQDWLHQRGFPPTIREIGAAVGISSTSVVNYNLNKLVEVGLIVRSDSVSRGIKLNLPDEMGALPITEEEALRVPLLGKIVAGQPAPVPEDIGYYYDESDLVTVPRMLLGNHDLSQIYALRVSGHSMIDAMISDGDMVILRKAETARNGEMVAAWLIERSETTLKHYFEEGERIRLQPANPTMEPIYVDKDKVQVQGRVLAVLRRLS